VDRADGGFYPKVFALVTAGLLGYALVLMAMPFAGAICWALLLALLLSPLNEMLARALAAARLAALLLTLGGLLLIFVPAAMVGVAFASQAGELVARIQELTERHHISQVSDLLRVPVADRVFRWLGSFAPISADQVQAWLVQNSRGFLLTLVGVSGAALSSVLGAVWG
jgi:predicted PurR-regulated permease PerM